MCLGQEVLRGVHYHISPPSPTSATSLWTCHHHTTDQRNEALLLLLLLVYSPSSAVVATTLTVAPKNSRQSVSGSWSNGTEAKKESFSLIFGKINLVLSENGCQVECGTREVSVKGDCVVIV